MIRNAIYQDLPALRTIAAGTNMFIGEELDAFLAMMEQHVSAEIPEAATLLVVTDNEMHDAPVVGAAYFAPEVMAQGVMNLLFIGVLGTARRRGFGAQLLEQFEEAAQGAGSRLAIIETASERQFAPAWALYQRRGYEEEARVRDYYDRGVHKLIFRKALPHTV